MKRKWLMLAAVILTVSLAAGCSNGNNSINVTTAKVKTEVGIEDTSYTGTVKAESMVEITANVTGKVSQVFVKEGQTVQPGDLLFQLDSTDYSLQANQVQATLNAAQVVQTSAQASASSNAGVIPAQTASADAHANYERVKILYDAGGVSKAEFEAAQSKMDTADAQLAAAKIAQKSSSDGAAAQVVSARAAYELAAQRVADCTVKAPIAGQASQISVETGSVVSMQVPAMSVVDNSKLKISIDVLERDVQAIAPGMSAMVAVQSLGKTCQGMVYEVSPSADEKTGMFRVSVSFTPEDGGILSGMAATVTLISEKEGGTALYVPVKSIAEDENGSHVFILDGDLAKQKQVTLGVKKNQYVEILSGLAEDDLVIVQAGAELRENAKVKAVAAQ